MVDSAGAGQHKWHAFTESIHAKALKHVRSCYEKLELEQKQLEKLQESVFSKFEFIGNEVTLKRFERMILTWMRKSKNRWTNTMSNSKAPPKKVIWEALRRTWAAPDS